MNALRFDTRYVVNQETVEQVRHVVRALGLEEVERHHVEMGYVLPLPRPESQIRLLDGVVEPGRESRVETAPQHVDLDRILANVRHAAGQSDVVLASLHTQEWLESDEQPAQLACTFAHACVDEGADAVVMSGPHVLAPEGQHTAWAYCHVPPGSTEDMTARIEAQVERFAPGFRDLILERSALTPADMHAKNRNYVGGDINVGAMDLGQLFTRPARKAVPYRTPLKGVYLCSAATPPGGGVHGMCGWSAARVALRDLSERT